MAASLKKVTGGDSPAATLSAPLLDDPVHILSTKKLSADQGTVLFIGQGQVGKSAVINLLMDSNHVEKPHGYETKTEDPTISQFDVLTKGSECFLTLIDTPGLKHVQHEKDKPKDARKDEEFQKTASLFLEHNLKNVSVIALVFNINAPISDEQLDVFHVVMEYLGKSVATHCLLVFTHCEGLTDKDCVEQLKMFDSSEHGREIREQCKLGVVFMGSRVGDRKIAEEVFEKRRQRFLNLLVNQCRRKPVPITFACDLIEHRKTEEIKKVKKISKDKYCAIQ
jgi:GTP-binding protein EngB required for normal cell division